MLLADSCTSLAMVTTGRTTRSGSLSECRKSLTTITGVKNAGHCRFKTSWAITSSEVVAFVGLLNLTEELHHETLC